MIRERSVLSLRPTTLNEPERHNDNRLCRPDRNHNARWRSLLHGVADDLIDNDNLLAVASYVAGAQDVVDGLRARGLLARRIAIVVVTFGH